MARRALCQVTARALRQLADSAPANLAQIRIVQLPGQTADDAPSGRLPRRVSPGGGRQRSGAGEGRRCAL